MLWVFKEVILLRTQNICLDSNYLLIWTFVAPKNGCVKDITITISIGRDQIWRMWPPQPGICSFEVLPGYSSPSYSNIISLKYQLNKMIEEF